MSVQEHGSVSVRMPVSQDEFIRTLRSKPAWYVVGLWFDKESKKDVPVPSTVLVLPLKEDSGSLLTVSCPGLARNHCMALSLDSFDDFTVLKDGDRIVECEASDMRHPERHAIWTPVEPAVVDRAKQTATLKRLTKDGTSWIGCFECQAMDSAALGDRFATVFSDALWAHARVGETRAPDTSQMGLGWKWILGLKTRDPAEASEWVLREGRYADGDGKKDA